MLVRIGVGVCWVCAGMVGVCVGMMGVCVGMVGVCLDTMECTKKARTVVVAPRIEHVHLLHPPPHRCCCCCCCCCPVVGVVVDHRATDVTAYLQEDKIMVVKGVSGCR